MFSPIRAASLNVDLRGNFETPGQLRFAGFENDILDLHVVVQHLTREYGYVIDLLVGHSRGSAAGLIWLCRYPKEETGTVRGYVNVSGRYRMSVSGVTILYGIDMSDACATENVW